MKLWTVQPLSVLEDIEKNGTFRCDKNRSFNLSKKNSLEDQYRWLIERMETKIGIRPEGVDFPIWAWHSWEGQRQCPDINSPAFLKRTEDKVLLTLEVPEDQVVLTDFDAWQNVLSDGFVINETDQDKLDALEEYLEGLDEEELENAIKESWENVFDITRIDLQEFQRGNFIQATFWEIKKEYIVETRLAKAEV